MKDFREGLDLDPRSNAAQATTALICAAAGACIGISLVKQDHWIAALAGAFVGLVAGTFAVGFVLMVWPRPPIEIDQARAKFELAYKRFVRMRRVAVVGVLLMFTGPILLGKIDATWAFVSAVCLFFGGLGLRAYTLGIKDELEAYRKVLEKAKRD